MNNDYHLNTADTAELLSVTTVTVRRWTEDGLLDCVKTPGGHRRYSALKIIELVKEREKEAHLSNGDGIEPDPESDISKAEFYNRINMANTVLKLNVTMLEALSSMDDEFGRVDELISSTLNISCLKDFLNGSEKEMLTDHVVKLVTGLQYQDLYTQRLGAIKGALDNINSVFKASLSDYNGTQLSGFTKEVARSNVRVDSQVLDSFIRELVNDRKPSLDMSSPRNEDVKHTEIFK